MRFSPTKDQFVYYTFAAMIAGLPFSKALSSVALTILLFLALPDLIQSGLTIWQKYRAFFAVSGLLVFYLISVGYSDQLTNALKFCYQQNILLTLPLIWVAHRERLLPHLTGFLKVFIYACGFTSVVTLLLFVLPEATTSWISNHVPGLNPYEYLESRIKFGLYSPFIDRLHFSYLLGLALLGLLWMRQKKIWSEWITGSAIIIVTTFLFLGGRGAQLGLLLILFIWIWKWVESSYANPNQWNTAKKWGLGTILFIGYFVLAPALLFQTLEPVKARYDQLFWEMKLLQNGEYKQWDYRHFTTLRRLLSIKNHYRLIARHPLSGVGVGDYRRDLQDAYNEDRDTGLDLDANAHNQFLFIWANAGLLAFGYFIWLMYFVGKKAMRIVDDWTRTLAVSVLIFFVFLLLFDVFIIYQIGAMVFVLSICLILEGSNKP
ncbi:MAG: O-antigen ligase family protein [Saprospiraceae bacterium]|nr:O-antigen ligase family protein [Saprospiraceae bacterium]HPG09605.1 O-antigen ligase family protein [Saprospiraceae bacterium]